MADSGRSATEAMPAGGMAQLLFSFRGRAGRRQYRVGIAAALVIAIIALALGGQAMSTNGGDSVVLVGLPLTLLFVWIHAAVTIKRLRDAGLPAMSYLLFIAAPMIAIVAAVEFIEQGWLAIVVAVIGLLAAPGLLRTRTGTAQP